MYGLLVWRPRLRRLFSALEPNDERIFAKLQLKSPRPPRDEVVEHRSYDGGDLAKHGINGRQRQREDILEVPTSLLVS